MSKNDVLNDTDLLNTSQQIELLESRKKQLLKRKNLCKDQTELKAIEKQLKQAESLLKKLQKRKTKIPRTKAG